MKAQNFFFGALGIATHLIVFFVTILSLECNFSEKILFGLKKIEDFSLSAFLLRILKSPFFIRTWKTKTESKSFPTRFAKKS